MTEPDWQLRLAALLEEAQRNPPRHPRPLIEAVAELAFTVPETQADAWLDALPPGPPPLAALYLRHLMEQEGGEAERLLTVQAAPGSRFEALTDDKGRTAYRRVEDMFEHVAFGRCRHMVSVGCGPLPVTALHVIERTSVQQCLLLDELPEPVRTCQALIQRFGWHRLQARVARGEEHDYADAQVVFIANAVRPKAATLGRVLATAAEDVQIVLREPWSLGRLWTERGEDALDARVEVVARGPASRHLSRDLFLRRRR